MEVCASSPTDRYRPRLDLGPMSNRVPANGTLVPFAGRARETRVVGVNSIVRGCAVRAVRVMLACAAAALPAAAHASFLSGEALDTAANVLAWFILCVVPFVAIGAFLYVHVLPEVIAEKRHHPQKHAIKVVCILSLFFGGMLWPIAWIWAYTRPIAHRAIYGTEKHEDYYVEMGEKAREGGVTADQLDHLRHELDVMATRGALTPALQRVRDDLAAAAAESARARARETAPVAGGDE